MGVYKRGNVYWFDFWFRGERHQRSTGQGNHVLAARMESAYKTALLKGEVGIVERKPAPTLREFKQRFVASVETNCADKPATVIFYKSKLGRLLEFSPLADARLDRIDESLIESYVQHRRKVAMPASVNRELATLRKALRLAMKWRVIDRVPSFKMLGGERERTFVLTHAQEKIYLEFAPQPLHDLALLMLDTGLRVGEACALQWCDIHLEPVNGARFGYLHVSGGKTKYAKRNIPLTDRARAMLERRNNLCASSWVFPRDSSKARVRSVDTFLSSRTLWDYHEARRDAMRLPSDFVIHSFRHTFGTRLGEARADAFTIMRLMGHSSVTVSQKYVHPSPEAMERAVERLEAFNERAARGLPSADVLEVVPTVFPTPTERQFDTVRQVF